MSSLDDSAFQDIMDQPATRAELMKAMRLTHALFLSQAMMHLAQMRGDDRLRRQMGENIVDDTATLLEEMGNMTARWVRDA